MGYRKKSVLICTNVFRNHGSRETPIKKVVRLPHRQLETPDESHTRDIMQRCVVQLGIINGGRESSCMYVFNDRERTVWPEATILGRNRLKSKIRVNISTCLSFES